MIPFSSRRRALTLAVSLGVFAAFSGGSLAAKERELTPYEASQVLAAKETLRIPGDPEPNPDGKLIERVDVLVLEVFDDSDPIPNFVNVFHARTLERVVRRELLFTEGESFESRLADESSRNLRKLRQHSLVVVLPFPGSTKDRVRVLVLLKDVWSLRLNWDVAFSDRELSYLVIQPTEENLFGTHTTLGGQFSLTPGTYSFGAFAIKRRLFGSDLAGTLSANAVYGRATNDPEGATGLFTYGVPFTRTDQDWSWGTGVYLRSLMQRRYQGLRVEKWDVDSTVDDEALPIEYRDERIIGGFEAVRSFGRVQKLDVGLGYDVDRRYYRWDAPPGTSARAERAFREQWVPVSDTRTGPFLQLHAHEERYLHTSDLDTLAFEEIYRLGLSALLRVYPASTRFGSTRDLVGVLAGASYTLPLGDGLVRVLGVNRTELERAGRHDADITARIHIALPRFEFLRLVLDGGYRDRYENYLNRNLELGGDTRLRGYPPAGFQDSLVGPVFAGMNAELRTTSIDLLSMQSGLAAFYDAGDVAADRKSLSFKQAAGFGLRLVFPQFSRLVARVDWAFPFNPAPGYRTFPGRIQFAFEQAFSVPDITIPTALDPVP